MKVRTLNHSLAEKYWKGEITLYEVAREFCKHGWTNYVDIDFAKREMNRLEDRV